MKKLIFYLITFSLYTSFLYSQNDSALSIGFILPELKIEREKAGYVVTNHFENEYNLFSISNDSLFGNRFKNNYKAALNDITSIAIVKGNESARGALFGAVFGFIGGFLWGALFQSNTLSSGDHDLAACMLSGFYIGIGFSLPGALIGSFLGLATPRYEEVKFSRSNGINNRENLLRALSEFGYEYQRKGKR